jgi:tetratricopeptide (TPR) repeat protein
LHSRQSGLGLAPSRDDVPKSDRLLAAALTAVALLCGCTLLSPTPPMPNAPLPGASSGIAPPRAPPPTAPTPPPPPPARENHLSRATHSLVTQACSLIGRGDFDGASSTLDRALRIEPNNPLLWVELGRLRLAENDAHQAEGCGRKALALASGDHGTQAQAGRLLADALRAQRRNQEAREVESQPYMH